MLGFKCHESRIFLSVLFTARLIKWVGKRTELYRYLEQILVEWMNELSPLIGKTEALRRGSWERTVSTRWAAQRQ